MNNSIFRKYDIRGIFKKDLYEHDAYNIAKAIALLAQEDGISQRNICIARDGRLSSPQLANALINAFIDAGYKIINDLSRLNLEQEYNAANIVNSLQEKYIPEQNVFGYILYLGIASTPLLYWATYNLDNIGVGIIVTGSHNPKHYNGFKIVYNSFYAAEDFLIRLRNKIEQNQLSISFRTTSSQVNSSPNLYYEKFKCSEQFYNLTIKGYIDNILGYVDYAAHIKPQDHLHQKAPSVVWDASNGAMSVIMRHFVNKLPGNHYIINGKVDGNFHSHPPDPTIAANLQQVSQFIKNNKCDFGVCFDGDGDRLGIVLGGGRILYSDHILVLIAYHLLKKKPNIKILVDVRISKFVIDLLEKLGAQVEVWVPGHSKIKNKMMQDSIELAAEMSGHIFFNKQHYVCDDALIAAYEIYKLFAYGYDFDEILKPLLEIVQSEEIRIEMSIKLQLLFLYIIKNFLHNNGIEFDDMDGVRVVNNHYSWSVRSANTEEMISIHINAINLQYYSNIIEIISNTIKILESAICMP